MWSKFGEVQCAFAVAEVRKVTANLSQTCGFAEHLLQFCGIYGCGIEYKFAVPSSAQFTVERGEKASQFACYVGLCYKHLTRYFHLYEQDRWWGRTVNSSRFLSLTLANRAGAKNKKTFNFRHTILWSRKTFCRLPNETILYSDLLRRN